MSLALYRVRDTTTRMVLAESPDDALAGRVLVQGPPVKDTTTVSQTSALVVVVDGAAWVSDGKRIVIGAHELIGAVSDWRGPPHDQVRGEMERCITRWAEAPAVSRPRGMVLPRGRSPDWYSSPSEAEHTMILTNQPDVKIDHISSGSGSDVIARVVQAGRVIGYAALMRATR